MCLGVKRKKTIVVYVILHNLVDLKLDPLQYICEKPYLSSRITM